MAEDRDITELTFARWGRVFLWVGFTVCLLALLGALLVDSVPFVIVGVLSTIFNRAMARRQRRRQA